MSDVHQSYRLFRYFQYIRGHLHVIMLVLVVGISCVQMWKWSQVRVACVPVSGVRQAFMLPNGFRWSGDKDGIRLGAAAVDKTAASIGDLPLFVENTRSTFQFMELLLICRFQFAGHDGGAFQYQWCQARLLDEGMSFRMRFASVPHEVVVLPPLSMSRLTFDAFGEGMYWGRSVGIADARLDREPIDLATSYGEVSLYAGGSKDAWRFRVTIQFDPADLPDGDPASQR